MERIVKENYYLDIAETVLERSTCLRRQYGAIIVRNDEIVGHDAKTGAILSDATSCSMCRRMIINAGLRRVVIRNTKTEFTVVPVQDWIDQDDTLEL